MDEQTAKLFQVVEQTMEKVKPIASEGAKVAGGFAQELVKILITLNAGGLVAFPTFFHATVPTAAVTNIYLVTCGLFGGGVLFGTLGMVLAFIMLFRSFRTSTYATMLPMLQLQKQLIPHTMDTLQTKRLNKAERSSLIAESQATLSVVIFTAFCIVSLGCLIAGGLAGARAIVSAPGSSSHQIGQAN